MQTIACLTDKLSNRESRAILRQSAFHTQVVISQHSKLVHTPSSEQFARSSDYRYAPQAPVLNKPILQPVTSGLSCPEQPYHYIEQGYVSTQLPETQPYPLFPSRNRDLRLIGDQMKILERRHDHGHYRQAEPVEIFNKLGSTTPDTVQIGWNEENQKSMKPLGHKLIRISSKSITKPGNVGERTKAEKVKCGKDRIQKTFKNVNDSDCPFNFSRSYGYLSTLESPDSDQESTETFIIELEPGCFKVMDEFVLPRLFQEGRSSELEPEPRGEPISKEYVQPEGEPVSLVYTEPCGSLSLKCAEPGVEPISSLLNLTPCSPGYTEEYGLKEQGRKGRFIRINSQNSTFPNVR